MFAGHVPVWKKVPFIRFLLPLMTGIIVQWYFQSPIKFLWIGFTVSLLLLLLTFLFSSYQRYKLAVVAGVAITSLFIILGGLLAWYKDIRYDPAWYGNHYQQGALIMATLKEPPVEKTNSYKVLATVTGIEMNHKFFSSKGDVLIYFKKEAPVLTMDHGSQIIFSKSLQEIKNAGNPGGFDYKRYCLFQGITHQVYLQQNEFVALNQKKKWVFGRVLFPIRRKVLSILRKNIDGEKEYGLAEALLIGYKDDLDKNLVQSYTNTGVVHIIAISGMHIALIYWMLAFLCRPLKKIKYSQCVVVSIILGGLWLFSLLAGGQPSVLRSAVMFTCIVFAQNFAKKASTYNTLAFSAFVLLCMNPYWLWDVGFQLSYAAVLSILIFMRPIYNWCYIKNKALDLVWKLNAVSIAAQLLTTPFSLYHFHQFPNLFLLTNLIAVPLSGIIVLGEIFLCIVSFIPFLCNFLGKILSFLIWIMNSHIERVASIPYALWDGIQITVVQVLLLIFVVAGFGYWLLEKQKSGVYAGVFALLFFVILRSSSFSRAGHQKELIVYNVPKHEVIDIINGRNYFFIGDSDLAANDFAINFHIKPSRVLHRIDPIDHLPNLSSTKNFLQSDQKRIFVIDKSFLFDTCAEKIAIDLLIISKKPRLGLSRLSKTFHIKQVVFDSSVPEWKIKYWTKDCDSLRIPYWIVNQKGAFVMSLN